MKQKISYAIILLPLLFAVIVLLLPGKNIESHGQEQLQYTLVQAEISPEKLIFFLQYIGKDYGAAVADHKVINDTEYEEMTEFATTSLEWYSQLRPAADSLNPIRQKLEHLNDLVANKADHPEIKQLTDELIHDLSQDLSVIPFPLQTPDLNAGEKYYGMACVDCHGVRGDGRGPAAAWLNPQPSNFQEVGPMNEATPHQFFNAITFGVEGTAMPSHQQAFTNQQRWDLAFYLMTFRQDFSPQAKNLHLKFSVNELAITSNKNLLAQLRQNNTANTDDSALLKVVDYFRGNPPKVSSDEQITYTQQKLHESFEVYKKGNTNGALRSIFDAYLSGLEPVEPLLTQKRNSLVTRLETNFSRLRSAVREQQPVAQVTRHYERLNENLQQARLVLDSSRAESGFVLLQSGAIILREGIEATLLIALMITYLISAGYYELKRYVVAGALAGLAAGGITWIITNFFAVAFFNREAMEGVTSLLAAAVLFSVSFWIIHKVDIQKWKSFIQTKAERAMGTGSGLALSAAAFLAVFREAFETVLFYQALWLRDGSESNSIIIGFAIGSAALAIMLFLIFKVGIRLPLKPFFACTGILLGLLAFVFAGYGVRELQSVGMLKETLLPWGIRWELLDIYPTLEGLALQLGILASFLLGWFSVLADKFRMEKQYSLREVAVGTE